MTLETKFDIKQNVRHILNEFQGFVTGVAIRPGSIEYEVLPVTDDGANFRPPVWVCEEFLETVTERSGDLHGCG